MTEQMPPRNGPSTDGHLTDEDLAVLADPRLSEAGSTSEAQVHDAHQPPHPGAREHVELCAPCRAALEATERALQALRDPAALHQPPAELWDRIAAEIAATPEHPFGQTPSRRVQDQDAPDQDAPDQDAPDQDAPDQGAPDPNTPGQNMPDHSAQHSRGASVTELRPRDSRRGRRRDSRRGGNRDAPRTHLWIPLAAAAAGAVLGGAAVAALLGQDDVSEVENPVASPVVVGGATLEPVAADDFTGSAEMVETDDGALQLTVEISAAPDPEAGYFEVWLRDEDGTQLISLGAATADSTTFTVPAGIDLSQYPVVDVSHEHFDGDPGHSGTTLAAGPMQDPDS